MLMLDASAVPAAAAAGLTAQLVCAFAALLDTLEAKELAAKVGGQAGGMGRQGWAGRMGRRTG
jgi:homoserine acetyltransferase